jgi:hypothetical protein
MWMAASPMNLDHLTAQPEIAHAIPILAHFGELDVSTSLTNRWTRLYDVIHALIKSVPWLKHWKNPSEGNSSEYGISERKENIVRYCLKGDRDRLDGGTRTERGRPPGWKKGW